MESRPWCHPPELNVIRNETSSVTYTPASWVAQDSKGRAALLTSSTAWGQTSDFAGRRPNFLRYAFERSR
ncbi:hypothetical protein TNCV_4053451 [Trichonephila clavipes]|nr:hypothetical protein TNCV_4053451 [Trichonephila clavipes]